MIYSIKYLWLMLDYFSEIIGLIQKKLGLVVQLRFVGGVAMATKLDYVDLSGVNTTHIFLN